MKVFCSENYMVESVLDNSDFWELLGFNNWLSWSVRELKGYFGRPDLLVGFGKKDSINRHKVYTCAFEMKLRNWKRGIIQAYRYKAFANYSYLVIDDYHSNPALINIDQFINANIGLICVQANGPCKLHYRPKLSKPYSSVLRTKLVNNILAELF